VEGIFALKYGTLRVAASCCSRRESYVAVFINCGKPNPAKSNRDTPPCTDEKWAFLASGNALATGRTALTFPSWPSPLPISLLGVVHPDSRIQDPIVQTSNDKIDWEASSGNRLSIHVYSCLFTSCLSPFDQYHTTDSAFSFLSAFKCSKTIIMMIELGTLRIKVGTNPA
jgi:hypothetical protein